MAAKKKQSAKKSRAESVTGKKEGEVEVRTAAKIGDNSKLKLPAPNDFEHHYKSMRGAKDKVTTANTLSKQASEAANKCSPGLAATIKTLFKIEDENDPAKLQRTLEMMGMGLKHINCPIQLSVFDTLQGDVSEQAYKRGMDDGKSGRTANNSYPENSDLYVAYADGWRHGTAANLGITPEEADAALQQQGETVEAEEEEPAELIAAE